MRTWQESGHLQARERDLATHQPPTDTLILDLQPADLGENEFLVSKPPRLWYFVMAALECRTVRQQSEVVGIMSAGKTKLQPCGEESALRKV